MTLPFIVLFISAAFLKLTYSQNFATLEFTCNNENCIPDYYFCDGIDDCGDNSDGPGNEGCPPCNLGEVKVQV